MPGLFIQLFLQLLLLLAFGVRLVAVLVGGLRVLFRSGRMLLALCVIALAVVLGGGAVSLGGIVVVLCGLVVLVSCHCRFLVVRSQRQPNRR